MSGVGLPPGWSIERVSTGHYIIHISRFWRAWCRARYWWYRWRHPRCTRDGECLLDDGHAGECDIDAYE